MEGVGGDRTGLGETLRTTFDKSRVCDVLVSSFDNRVTIKLYRDAHMNIEQTVLEKLKTLPAEKQQEVLDFVEFLQSKTHQRSNTQESKPVVSALTLAQKWVGCLEGGPPDLSTNKKYMEGYGE